MRSLLIILAGLALLGVCVLVGRHVGGVPRVMKLFITLWFVLAFVNMWLGTRAGYSWTAEAPIFLLIFGVPATVAVFVGRK